MPISYPETVELPFGYVYKEGPEGELQLWNTLTTPPTLLSSNYVDKMRIHGDLVTNLNTLYLEEAHAISSAGEDVVFKNLNSNILFSPLWCGVAADGTTISAPTYFKYTTLNPVDVFPNGQVAAATSVSSEYTGTSTANLAFFKYTFVAAEAYQGKLKMESRALNGKVIFRREANVNVAAGDEVVIENLFTRLFTGQGIRIGVYKEDGSPLMVRAGATDNTKPYRKVLAREYEPRGIVYVNPDGHIDASLLPDIDAIELGSVVNKADLLVLPTIAKFRIYIVTSESKQYYLNESADPSVEANWHPGASTAAAVASFNSRTGAVVPQSGDYSASMVGALALPTVNDGVRRVVKGQNVVEEHLDTSINDNNADSPVASSVTHALAAAKQDVITGGASTIASSNLTASRALVSNSQGKVAVSAVTDAELGHLAGVTSGVQGQLNYLASQITTPAAPRFILKAYTGSREPAGYMEENVLIATANGVITPAMIPGEYLSDALSMPTIAAAIEKLSAMSIFDGAGVINGLLSSAFAGFISSSTYCNQAWPTVDPITFTQGSSLSSPTAGFRLVVGATASNIYFVNVVPYTNGLWPIPRSIGYERQSGWADVGAMTATGANAPLIRSVANFTTNASASKDNSFISTSWPMLALVPVRLPVRS